VSGYGAPNEDSRPVKATMKHIEGKTNLAKKALVR
jgi:hypothetical protein